MGIPKNRQESLVRERRVRVGVVMSCAVLSLFGVIACGYGHAALSRDLMISGDGTVKPSGTFGIETMQEMTPEVCDRATVGTMERLTDTRDGQKYWVAKQVDNKCWMTQDLRLNITTAGFTSKDTDLQAGTAEYEELTDGTLAWNANSKYPPQNTTSGLKAQGEDNTTYSWDLGLFVLKEPMKYVECSMNTGLKRCPNQVTEIDSSYEPTLDYRVAGKTVDTENKTYDAHYLIGNYYQYQTVTAGSAQTSGFTTANSSICPKGWRLPEAGYSGGTLENEGLKVLDLYMSINDISDRVLYAATWPFYLVRGGSISGGNYIIYVGSIAEYATLGNYRAERNEFWIYGLTAAGPGENRFSYRDGVRMRCIARTGLEKE